MLLVTLYSYFLIITIVVIFEFGISGMSRSVLMREKGGPVYQHWSRRSAARIADGML